MMAEEQTAPDTLNIEELMGQIRRQILQEKAASGDPLADLVPVDGKRFPPDFYDHLYQASLMYDKLLVERHVTKSPIPLLGPLIDRGRGVLHRLVLFYVNEIAAQQIEVNTHLLYVVSMLANELEEEWRVED